MNCLEPVRPLRPTAAAESAGKDLDVDRFPDETKTCRTTEDEVTWALDNHATAQLRIRIDDDEFCEHSVR